MKGLFALLICIFPFGILLQPAVGQSELTAIPATEDAATKEEQINKCEDPDVLVVNADVPTMVMDDQNVVLSCKFHIPMNCKWEIQNEQDKRIPTDVNSSMRYEFCRQSSGVREMDCSLIITKFQSIIDPKNWNCIGKSSGIVPEKKTLSYTLLVSNVSTDQPVSDSSDAKSDITTHDGATDALTPMITEAIELSSEATSTMDREIVDSPSTVMPYSTEVTDLLSTGEQDLQDVPPSLDVQIVEPPTNATVSVGEPLTIICVFNTKVNCFWTKNSEKLDPESPFVYADGNKGENTVNCTLTTESVVEKGISEWECSNQDKPEDLQNVVLSKAWIEINEPTSNQELMFTPDTKEVETSITMLRPTAIEESTPNLNLMSTSDITEVESNTVMLSSIATEEPTLNQELMSTPDSTEMKSTTAVLIPIATEEPNPNQELMSTQDTPEVESSTAVLSSLLTEEPTPNQALMSAQDTTEVESSTAMLSSITTEEPSLNKELMTEPDSTEVESSTAMPSSKANEELLAPTSTSQDRMTRPNATPDKEMESSTAVLNKFKDQASSKDQLESASSTAVTVIVSSVVICLIGITVTVSMCLYKRRKHTYAPKQLDTLVVHETRPSSSNGASEKEVKPLLVNIHPNGQPKAKLSETESSLV